MSFTAKEKLDITAANFDELISYIENSDNFWLIKYKNYKFAYINKIGKHYLNLGLDYNFEGRYIGEMPTLLSDFQDIIHDANNKVISGGKNIPAMFNAIYGGINKQIQPFVFDNARLLKDGDCIGLMARGRRLDLFSMDNFANKKLPEPIHFGNPSKMFTNKEFEVVFYILQRFSAKEIAQKMGLTPKGVESHVYNIYQKTGVSARTQLITLCRDKGYDKYVPEKFLGPAPIKFFG